RWIGGNNLYTRLIFNRVSPFPRCEVESHMHLRPGWHRRQTVVVDARCQRKLIAGCSSHKLRSLPSEVSARDEQATHLMEVAKPRIVGNPGVEHGTIQRRTASAPR